MKKYFYIALFVTAFVALIGGIYKHNQDKIETLTVDNAALNVAVKETGIINKELVKQNTTQSKIELNNTESLGQLSKEKLTNEIKRSDTVIDLNKQTDKVMNTNLSEYDKALQVSLIVFKSIQPK